MDFGDDDGDLSGIDANTGGLDDDFAFVATDTDGAVANSITWHDTGSITIIRGDVTGDAVADFEIELSGSHTLAAADFDGIL
jgi:hypothetical protein